MANGEVAGPAPQARLQPSTGPNVQAHLARASRFANGQKRDWSLFFFFRILPQAEVDSDFAQLKAFMAAMKGDQLETAQEEAQKLLATLHNPSMATAGLVDQKVQEEKIKEADAPSQFFLDWLKVITGPDANPLAQGLRERLVEAGIPPEVCDHVPLEGVPAEAVADPSRTSARGSGRGAAMSLSDKRLSARNFTERGKAMSALGDLWAVLRPMPAMFANRKLFAAFLRSFGKTAQQAGLNALAGGLPGIVFYELLRQAAPALWGSKQGAIVRSEADVGGKAKEAALPWDNTPINFAFTYSGLKALKLNDTILSSFPEAFKEGMAERAERLGDTGPSAPEHWQGVLGLDRVHGYFTGGFAVGSDETPVQEKLWQALRDQIRAFNNRTTDEGQELRVRLRAYFKLLGMDILHIELGQDPYEVENKVVKKLEHRKEHFGFRDGISQPFVDLKLRDSAPGGGTPRRNRTWSPVAAGEIYLDQPDEDGNLHQLPASELLRRGSTFLVFRKLEQDVAGFRAFLSKQRPESKKARAKLAAQIVGRWPNGTPLVLSPDAPLDIGPDSDGFINDFLYAADDPLGVKCPLGAHARRSNPRDIGGTNDVRRHRILRRGMAYGGPLLPKKELGDGNRRGLLFVAACSRIDLQFEVIQSNWLNKGDFLGQAGLNRCPLTGAGSGGPEDAFLEAGAVAPITGIPRFVTTRGGDYFFAPGLDALKAIADDPRKIKAEPLPYLGQSLGDTETPKLFSERRLQKFAKQILAGNPSVIRVKMPPPGVEGAATAASAPASGPTVAFVGQLEDVRKVLSMGVATSEKGEPQIIYSVNQYRAAIHRFSFGRDMLVATERGSKSSDARDRLRTILDEAWAELGDVGPRLDTITRNSIEKALRATSKSGRIDLVHDLASSAVYDVLVKLYGTPGPDWVTELALSLPFAHQHVGMLQPDWLTAAQTGAPDNVGLVTLQIWSILIFLDIVGNYEQQPELMGLAGQAASELLSHLGTVIANARAKGVPLRRVNGVPQYDANGAPLYEAPTTLLAAFVKLEKKFLAQFHYGPTDYYTDIRMLLLELVGTTVANVPATMGCVMNAVLKFNIPLTELIPVLMRPPVFAPPAQAQAQAQAQAYDEDEGIKRLIYETTRLDTFIKVLVRTCEQDDVLPSQKNVAPASQIKVKKGDVVAALLAVAAFDPRKDAFPEPRRLSLWPYLPGPERKLRNYLLFGAKATKPDESRDCWGRDKIALGILKECVKAAGRLQHLQKVAGPAGRAKTLANIVIGLSARFAGLLPDWEK